MKDQLFPLKKFIDDHELYLQHDRTKMAITTLVMAKLNIGNEWMVRFWNTYKGLVHKQRMETRLSSIIQVMKAFIKYIHDYKTGELKQLNYKRNYYSTSTDIKYQILFIIITGGRNKIDQQQTEREPQSEGGKFGNFE